MQTKTGVPLPMKDSPGTTIQQHKWGCGTRDGVEEHDSRNTSRPLGRFRNLSPTEAYYDTGDRDCYFMDACPFLRFSALARMLGVGYRQVYAHQPTLTSSQRVPTYFDGGPPDSERL